MTNKHSNQTVIQGMNSRQWQDLIVLIHKAQVKERKSSGVMDKIIENAVIWNDLDVLEEKVRNVCFKLH